MPSYTVKRSKKHPDQQQALDWLTACGKNKFDEKLAALLSQWGVKETHQGTCVLCPQEWSSLEPIHIIHATYEPAHNNHDRKNCSTEAQSLRQQGLSIAERCDKHDPPCLMQVSSPVGIENSGPLILPSTLHCPLSKLTAFNSPTCAKPKGYRLGLSPPDREDIDIPLLNPNFRSHQVSAPSFRNPEHLSSQALPANKEGRPDFICTFCTKIKSFTSAVGYWSHLFHKHEDSEEEERLKEIRRTVVVWRAYWPRYKERSRYGQNTLAKLEQVEREDFGWNVVQSWDFRR